MSNEQGLYYCERTNSGMPHCSKERLYQCTDCFVNSQQPATQKSEEERIREIMYFNYNYFNGVEKAAKAIYEKIIEPKDKRIAELEKENEKNHLNLKQ
jgi:hypothetical protein